VKYDNPRSAPKFGFRKRMLPHKHQAVDSFFLSFLLVFVPPIFSPFYFHSPNLPSLIAFHLVLRSLPSPLCLILIYICFVKISISYNCRDNWALSGIFPTFYSVDNFLRNLFESYVVETTPAAFNLFLAILEQTWLTYEHGR